MESWDEAEKVRDGLKRGDKSTSVVAIVVVQSEGSWDMIVVIVLSSVGFGVKCTVHARNGRS